MKIPYTVLDFSGEVAGIYSQWDMTLINDMLTGFTWLPAASCTFELVESHGLSTDYNGGVIIIPARQNAGLESAINAYIGNLDWCVVILSGDEERTFDYKKLHHAKMKLWLMQPKPQDVADFYIGSGYTPHTHSDINITDGYYKKPYTWSFIGQNNHDRRNQCVQLLNRLVPREDWTQIIKPTNGFAQGDTDEYIRVLAGSKAAPAPSGIASPDSFRVYEALELGSVPIADDISVNWQETGYWRKVFENEDVPFKILDDYANLEGYINDINRDYPAYQNKVYGWWQGYKRKMLYKLIEHIQEVSGPFDGEVDFEREHITVIILTSPIPSHPSTEIIDKTITDIRAVLPTAEILIGIDGVREEQENYTERYEEYKRQLLFKCNNIWHNVLPVVFDRHHHQSAMTRQLLQMVKTPTILFVEHDTALAPDFEYDWRKLVGSIENGEAYTIRFHFEATIPEDHKHLMIGEPELVNDIQMLRTAQWSQRPHLSSTVFYRDMMDRYFTDESRTMIEDKVHGPVAMAYHDDGLLGWYNWRLWIYYPEGDNIKRSYTTDGRGNDPKYDDLFVY